MFLFAFGVDFRVHSTFSALYSASGRSAEQEFIFFPHQTFAKICLPLPCQLYFTEKTWTGRLLQ